MTPALGALAQAPNALVRAAAAPQSGAEAAVATTIDFALLILGPLVGAFVGVVASIIFAVLARKALSKSAMASSILGRVRRSLHFTFAVWGAWVGLGVALVNPRLSDWDGASITTFLMHLLLIAGLACLTWVGYAAAWVFEDASKARQSADQGRSSRFETRAQVLRRFTQSAIAVIGLLAIIGTFEQARHAMTTVLASAGVISVIFGLAAQQTLGNVFAGLQLAFTDAIRVGDVVVAGDKHETGSVEEITLSYVVIRIWDERRLIIPCRYFTQTPFENWTRRAAAQLGTVELKLDWSAPMTLIRAKVERLLAATDLWDGRTWGVQIIDSDEYTVTVRVLVSAKNSGDLSDLRAYLREQLISWIVSEEPWARPAQRIEPRQTVTVEQDMSRERIARLASELAGIAGSNEAVAATGSSSILSGAESGESVGSALGGAAFTGFEPGGEGAAVRERPKDAAHAARMVAARRKAKRARRRAMADRQRELAEGGAPLDETQVISKSALRKIIEAAGNANPQVTQTLTATSVGRGERFFSGSADADERSAALSGPGAEAYAEREAQARRAQRRREGRKRNAEVLDPEETAALAAVGVEPVECDRDVESIEAAQARRLGAQGGDPVADDAPAAAQPAAVPAPAAASASGGGSAGEPTELPDQAEVASASGGVAGVTDERADAQATPLGGVAPDGAAPMAADGASSAAEPAAAVPAPAAAPTGNAAPSGDAALTSEGDAEHDSIPEPAGDAPASVTQGDASGEGASASSEAGFPGDAEGGETAKLDASEDEQATTPIPAREASVKQPVQVPPPARTGRPVMTDTVQAVAPAILPPPEPTPEEMAESNAEPQDEPAWDEPTVHPGWYAVAEEARLEAEIRPTPVMEPPRVSIMDFFPAVAPTGAEADMLRSVTGQMPVVGVGSGAEEETSADEAVAEAARESGADEAVAEPVGESGAEKEVAGAEAAADQAAVKVKEASDQDAVETAVMIPPAAPQERPLDAEATQVLPTIEEQPALDETLVMPAAAAAGEAATEAAAKGVEPVEATGKETTGKAPAEQTAAKKTAAKKTATGTKGTKKAPAKAAKDEQLADAPDSGAGGGEPPAKKGGSKKSSPKKGSKKTNARKTAAKKAPAKKGSTDAAATDK